MLVFRGVTPLIFPVFIQIKRPKIAENKVIGTSLVPETFGDHPQQKELIDPGTNE